MKKKADTPPVVVPAAESLAKLRRELEGGEWTAQPPVPEVTAALAMEKDAKTARAHFITYRRKLVDAAILNHEMSPSVLRTYAEEIATLKVLIDAINEPR